MFSFFSPKASCSPGSPSSPPLLAELLFLSLCPCEYKQQALPCYLGLLPPPFLCHTCTELIVPGALQGAFLHEVTAVWLSHQYQLYTLGLLLLLNLAHIPARGK